MLNGITKVCPKNCSNDQVLDLQILVTAAHSSQLCIADQEVTLGHFTFWISLSLSRNTTYTHRPQGVHYRGYLHVLKYLLLLLLY